jgi:hypothetical protein
LEEILSTSEVGPILALIAPNPFNHVCSGKDPDHADSNPDPRSVIDEKKRLVLFVFLVMMLPCILLWQVL